MESIVQMVAGNLAVLAVIVMIVALLLTTMGSKGEEKGGGRGPARPAPGDEEPNRLGGCTLVVVTVLTISLFAICGMGTAFEAELNRILSWIP